MANATEQIEKILSIKVDYAQAIEGIGRYMAALEDLKGREKDLKALRKEGVITGQQYQKEMAASKVKAAELKDEMRVLTTEVKKKLQADRTEMRQIDIKNASYNHLSQTYSLMKKKINDMTAAEREANKAYIEQSREVYERMKKLQEETGKMQLNVGNYQSAITGLITGNSRLGASLMGLTGGATTAGEAFKNIGASAKALGQALTTLLTNPVFLAIAGIAGVGMAFKFWSDYNDGISEANRLTKEFLESNGISATTEQVSAMRSEIQAMADTYGKDYKETLESVDSLMSQFGITAGEAMDVMNKGFASGADINGDMIDQIKQYGPAFHDAGIGASELVAMIQQTRSGIFSKDGMELVTKAGKNLRNMTSETSRALEGIGINAEKMKQQLASGQITMMQAIQQVSGGLKNVGANSQEAGAVIDDVFGKKGVAAGQQQIQALEGINTSLDEVLKTTGEYGENQQEIVKTQRELNQYTEALFGMNGWEELKQQAQLYVKKGLVAVVKWLVKAINYFVDLYNNSIVVRGAIQSIIVSLKNAWETVKLVFGLVAGIVKQLGTRLKGLGQMIEGVFTLDPDKMLAGYKTLVEESKRNFMDLGKKFKTFGSNVAKNYADGFNNTLSGRLEKITVDTSGAGDLQVTGAMAEAPGAGGKGNAHGGGRAGGKTGGGRGGSPSGGGNAADMLKAEQAEVEKAEELLTRLITDGYERQRQAVIASYDKRIAAIREKLAQEGKYTAKASEAMRTQITSLETLKERELAKIDEQRIQKEIEREQKRIELKLAAVRKGSAQELELKMRQLEGQEKLETAAVSAAAMSEEEKQQQITLIAGKYAAQRSQLQAEYDKRQRDEQALAMRNDFAERVMAASGNELEQLRIKLEQAKFMRDNARQEEGESDEQFRARKLQAEQEYQDAKSALNTKEVELEEQKQQAIAGLYGGLSDIMAAFGENSKAMAKASKILAMAEIAIETGKAIAKGVARAQETGPFPKNLVAILTTITAIMAGIAKAKKAVNSAKFARGGLVTGQGTGTSDSVPVMASNGESIMTAAATSMFSPLLSAVNQLGGGVPIMVQGGQQRIGEDLLAAAVAKGYAMAPRPVVSVEEINDVQSRVKVIEGLSVMR